MNRPFARRLSSASSLGVLPLASALFVSTWIGCGPPPPAPASVTKMAGVEVTPTQPAVDLAKDWPCWRGPSRDAIAACQSAPTEWSDSKNVLWSSPVPGRGHASPTVCRDAVYLATADEQAQRQSVVAFDRETGVQRWQTVVSEGGFPTGLHAKSTHANGTVACDGSRLFANFLHDDAIWLYALDLDGTIVWEKNLGAFRSQFGYAPSPAIYGSAVLVAMDSDAGGRLVAVDRESGEVAWIASRTSRPSYSSPAVVTIDGRDQIVLTGGSLTASYDPLRGEELWRIEGGSGTTCGTATFDGQRVYASGGYPENETYAIAIDGTATKVWSTRDRIYEPSLLAANGLLFAVTDDGIAICWDAATGEERWKERLKGSFSASPVLCGGNVYVPSASGETYVFKATGDAFKQISVNRLGTDAFATPTICDGRIYLRVGDSSTGARQEHLVCIGAKGT